MNDDHADIASRFPELSNADATLFRVAEAFVAPEYARAGLDLIRRFVQNRSAALRFGEATVITAPPDEGNIVVTVGPWWLVNFHISEAETLEEGDDADDVASEEHEEHTEAASPADERPTDERPTGEHNGLVHDADFDDSEMVEATFYQVGTFLLDGNVIPPETIFDREDIDCYAYDYPEERVAGDRFYWARLVWEPEDFGNEDLVRALTGALDFVLENYSDDAPFAELHDHDIAKLVVDAELTERVIASTDFGDIVIIDEDDTEGDE